MRKIIAILTAVFGLMMAVTPALAPDIDATATVDPQCGLTIDNSAINFDSVEPGTSDNPADNTVTASTDVEQNVQIDVTIGGTDWSGPSSMSVGQTQYSQDDGVSWNILTTSAPLFSSSTSYSETSKFVLDVPSNQPAGSYSQTITIGFSCE